MHYQCIMLFLMLNKVLKKLLFDISISTNKINIKI